jgi:sulfur carrier protein ThiS
VKVTLRNPDRMVEVDGPTTVLDLLKELDIVPESVLVIRDSTSLAHRRKEDGAPPTRTHRSRRGR